MTITVTDSSYKTPIYLDPTILVVIRPLSDGRSALVDMFGGVYNTVESPDQIIDLIEAEVAAVNAYTETYFVPDVTQDEKDQVIADLNQEIAELENEIQDLNDEIFNLTDEDEDLSEEDEDDLDSLDEDNDDFDDDDEDEDDLEDVDDVDSEFEDDEEELSLEEAVDILLGVFDKR